MNATLFYCPDCFDKLKSWGEIPASIFEVVCEYFATHDGSLIISEDPHFCTDGLMQIIQFLERKGFVTTTETLDDISIAIKPSDFANEDEEWYFCCDESHGFYDIMGFDEG